METLHNPTNLLPKALCLPPPAVRLKLSVIIPVRNEAEALTKTLMSLAQQVDLSGNALDPDCYEVLLLANNCTDDTADVSRCMLRSFPCL